MKLSQWTVDYGDGPRPISIPHAWRQDVPVVWEGPAVYRTVVERPSAGSYLLRFEGVSYAAAEIAPAGHRLPRSRVVCSPPVARQQFLCKGVR